MNREIKFRSWDVNENEMIYYHPLAGVDYKGSLACHSIDAEQVHWIDDYTNEPSDKFILMQYTGLKDKNGKEIYEGDIVKFHQFTQELGENLGVREGEKEFVATVGFGCAGITINEDPLFMYYGTHEESIEVIGNIYENPELLDNENN